ncbi:hypothetical protein Athai_62720 [Actinocatenispora thailandica]|uniref:Histidine kinase n=1 Tax=Actinocatenispora thailandica TaxID=227318 RepID=A0A7R7DW01_9ACTN|nr:hypothetical protein [Actinocatenispora thailandica]BCJ38769.1 hypothetical protein Athai_62720 [Actinocatenispora thailandica]
MDAATYAALLGTVLVLGAATLAGLAIYLLDRLTTRRHRPAPRLPDPYAEARALAARRRDPVVVRPAGSLAPSWRR